MKQGTNLGRQMGRWIILAALVVALGALLLTIRPAGAQDNVPVEFPENSTAPVLIFSATDPEDDRPIEWSLPGYGGDGSTCDTPTGGTATTYANADAVDNCDFKISSDGVLTFSIAAVNAGSLPGSPDFENAQGGGSDGTSNTYKVVVKGEDPEALGPEATYHNVVVMVTNEEEPGEVTWTIDHTPDATPTEAEADMPTLLQFQAGDILWASVEDGDLSGATKKVDNANVQWRWYRSATKSLTGGTLIEGANLHKYTVQDRTGSDDVGSYLRAEATYNDGSNVATASKVSDHPVQPFRTNDAAPTFGDDTSTVRSINEGLPVGTLVGDPVTATDANDTVLNYTLVDGNANVADGIVDDEKTGDSTKFKIHQETGQITTKVVLDYESSAGAANNCTVLNACSVKVIATDSSGKQTTGATDIPSPMTVTITVKKINDPPKFGAIADTTGDDNVPATGGDTNVSSQDIAENSMGTGDNGLEVAIYTATDPDANDHVLLSLMGDDYKMFELKDRAQAVAGQKILAFVGPKAPDYEMPQDEDRDNVYKVTVVATDRGNLKAYKHVTVRVTNVDEAPVFMKDTLTSYSFAENGKEAVATFTDAAIDPEGGKIVWSLATTDPPGDDLGETDIADHVHFDIDTATGKLTFGIGSDDDPPDYEMPRGNPFNAENNNNTYKVVVAAGVNGSTAETTGYHKVVVKVTNVAEPGKVTWTVDPDGAGNPLESNILGSATKPILQFVVGAKLSASVTDGDGNPNSDDQTWQWFRTSGSSSCSGTNVTPETGNKYDYTVVDDDAGSYLCAKVTYGTESAENVSKYVVGKILAEQNDTPTFGADSSVSGMVNEGMTGMKVAASVKATDNDRTRQYRDQLNYTLQGEGTDNSKFNIDQKTGQITTKVVLDYESSAGAANNCTALNACVVTVRATDSAGATTSGSTGPNADLTVNITLKNVNEMPTFDTPLITNLRTAIDRSENEISLITEGKVAAVNVTYTASDPDSGDSAILSLQGPDKDKFTLSSSGELSFVKKPDYEMPMDVGKDNRYNVTVRATDSTRLYDELMIAVNVTDVNEAPDVTRGGIAISGPSSVDDYAENSTAAVGTYKVSGPDAASARWSLEGPDAGDFMVEGSGASVMLKFRSSTGPDFEAPADADTNNVYMVTLKAMEGDNEDTHDVTVTVTNVEETGEVALPGSPVVGTPITATLADSDGGVTGLTWTWETSGDKAAWSAATGATTIEALTSSYTPVEGDVSMYLRATASYSDALGDEMESAMAVTGSMVASATDPLLSRYDTDGNGIQILELQAAVNDFYNEMISISQLQVVINAYYASSG